jgi:hypothetical protein
MENPLHQNFFRAGHAHAGVIVLLSLICEDSSVSVLPRTATQASAVVSLIYFGAVILAIAVVSLGNGLLRAPPKCNQELLAFER